MSGLLLLAGFAAAAWTLVLVGRGSLAALGMAVLLCTCVFGYEWLHFDLGPLPLTLDRCLLALLLAAWIVQWGLGRLPRRPWSATEWLLVGFVILLAASMFATDWQAQGVGASPVWRLVGGYLVPALLFLAARQAPLNEAAVRRLLWCVLLFGIYLSVTALAELAGQWSLVFPRYIADPKLGLHFGRARGPMLHSVSLGLYLCAALSAAVVLALGGGRWTRAVTAAVVPLFGVGLYGTYTRSVWLGAALAVFVILGLALRGRARTAVVGSLIACALLVGLLKLDSLLNLQREGSTTLSRLSAGMRASFAYVSWQMFLDRPLLGCGFGQFPRAKLPYLSDRSTELHLESIRGYVHHNTFLSLLVETGLVGLGLFLVLLLRWWRQAWRLAREGLPLAATSSLWAGQDLRHAPPAHAWMQMHGLFTVGLLAAWLPQLVFHEMSYTAGDNALVFFIAGLCCGLARGWPAADDGGRAARQRGSSPRSVDTEAASPACC
ncbi:MAG: O-antigen ligase family protein [Pirellulales bacterium]|nr:O-antigen ligase family protein [Pirellulales bacterium]